MPRRARALAATLVTALLAAAVLVAGAVPAQAAVYQSFDRVFSQNTNGDILMAANTLMSCNASTGTGSGTCAAARASTASAGGSYYNNNYTGQYVDVDGDSTTFNSSSATLTIPTDGTVLFAALVWGGRTSPAPSPDTRTTVRFTAPGSAAQDVTGTVATETGTGAANAGYQGYLDVTSRVRAAGSGVYTVGNVQSATAATNTYAGWGLVVAVADPNAPMRNLTVFRGFGSISNATGNTSQQFSVSGFLTPPTGPVKTTLGVITYEGDRGLGGDYLRLNGTTVSDALNDPADVFNSTISNRGSQVGGRTPGYTNQLGFDADLISADGIIPNGATSATIEEGTTSEQFYPGVITLATDLYDPKLNGTKTATLIDADSSGTPTVGDTLRYSVAVRNDGLDSATESVLFDAIPTGTTYVPGTITVDGAAVTDATGDDTGDFVTSSTGGRVVARIGTGASATAGGELPRFSTPSDEHTVAFDVLITSTVVPGQQLTNAADVVYTGKTTGRHAASVSNVVVNVLPNGPASTLTAPNRVLSFEPTTAQPGLVVDLLGQVTGGTAPVRLVAVTDAAGGTARINPDQTVTYTPSATYAGRDVFTYTVEDAAGVRKTATVKIDVIDTAPVGVDDSASIRRTVPTTVDPATNDTDANGDALTVYSVTANGSTGTVGQTVITATGGTLQIVNGKVVFTPPAAGLSPNATESFTYIAQDARGARATAPATVTLTAGNAAPAASGDALTVAKDATTAVTIDPRTNDSDPDGDALTVTGAGTAAHGTVSYTATGVSYTPTAGYAGNDSFTYTVSDGNGGTATATVTVKVDGAPVANPDLFTAPGAATSVSGNVLTAPGSADSDPNGDPLTVTAVGTPARGSLTWDPSGAVVFSPPTGFVGDETVSYSITDGTSTTTSSVTFRVQNVAPTATTTTATYPATTGGIIDVQAQVSDPNVAAGYQTLTTTAASSDNGATATIRPDGTVSVVPASGYSGPVTLTYTVSDGVATVTSTVSITIDDNAPSASPDSTSTPTNSAVDVDALANDSDPDGNALSISAVGTPVDDSSTTRGTVTITGSGSSGRVRYTPPTGWIGTVRIPYTISDGVKTATSTITITVDNADPVASDDTVTATDYRQVTTTDVLANDTDANIPGSGQSLSIVSSSADNGASVRTVAGGLEVTPAYGFRGVITVAYGISDGAAGSASAQLRVTVGDAPPIINPPTVTSAGAAVTVDLLGTSSDPNGDPLIVSSVGQVLGTDGQRRGTATLSNGRLTITPAPGYAGVLSVAYVISDGQGGTTPGIVSFTVTAPMGTGGTAFGGSGTGGSGADGSGTGSAALGATAGGGRTRGGAGHPAVLAATGLAVTPGLALAGLLLAAGTALLMLRRRRPTA